METLVGKTLLPYNYENLCVLCGDNDIKRKNEPNTFLWKI